MNFQCLQFSDKRPAVPAKRSKGTDPGGNKIIISKFSQKL